MPEEQTFIPPEPLHTAVLFLIYKRPDTTKQVFEAIRQAKPTRLYVAADGPKADVLGEAEKVQQARDIVLNGVDWDCEVKTLFRDTNLGCKYGVSGGIDWFFEHEEEGIILEDDTLPSQSFFWFCQELLERYRYDTRIFLISGYNKQGVWKCAESDYFFSNYGGIWGWASWRRAWAHNDINLKWLDEAIKRKALLNLLGKRQGKARETVIQRANCKIDTWDYSWGFSRHINNGLACVPSKSLIQNIGFSPEATHTIAKNRNQVAAQNIKLSLASNVFVVPDREYDALFFPVRHSLVRLPYHLSKTFYRKIKSLFKKTD